MFIKGLCFEEKNGIVVTESFLAMADRQEISQERRT